jgi:hypothetical protein
MNLMVGQGKDSKVYGARVDRITKSMQVINSDHAGIHEEQGFSVSGIFTNVANGATVNYAFKTPSAASGKMIHLKYKDIQATANKVRVDLYEAPTNAPTGGSNLTAYNRNRNSAATTAMQAIKSGMTIDTTGAAMLETSQHVNSVPRSADIELILKPDTWYIRTFTNGTGAAADISFFEFWYEED